MGNEKNHITLKGIAKIAGVSPATVSLALSGDKRVNIKTKEAVIRIAEEFNYVPNEIGRSLRSKKANTVALIFPSTTNNAFSHPYFVNLLEGVMDVLVENGFHLMINATPKNDNEEATIDKVLKNCKADGFILWPSSVKAKNISKIIESGFPLVYLSKWHDEDVITVEKDDLGAGYKATKHLIDIGRKKIIHIAGKMDLQASISRLDGYRKALEDTGIPFDQSLVFEKNYSKQDGNEVVETLIKDNIEFDAIFAASDLMAFGAMEALDKFRKKVPEDVAIVGCDDTSMSAMTKPSLSTIHLPMRKMGEMAAKRIIQVLRNEKIEEPHTMVPTDLVIRETSDIQNKNQLLSYPNQ